MGALKGLQGEATLLDDVLWLARPTGEGSAKLARAELSGADAALGAALFVVANVEAWHETVVHDVIPWDRLDSFVEAEIEARGGVARRSGRGPHRRAGVRPPLACRRRREARTRGGLLRACAHGRQRGRRPWRCRADRLLFDGSSGRVYPRRIAHSLSCAPRTITAFGSPRDVALEELRIESYFPLDELTAQTCRALAAVG